MRPDPTIKFISTDNVYQTINECNSKKFKITYCSLYLNNQCITSKKVIIKIRKVHTNCGFIEGVVLVDNEPYEDIVLKANQILSIECVHIGDKPEKKSIYSIIKNCNSLVKITQYTKLEKGGSKDIRSFPFLVTGVDDENEHIKGYRLRNYNQPEYMVIDINLILRVDCLTSAGIPGLPWSME